MVEQTYIITFDGISVSDANKYADELRDILLDTTPDIVVQRRRDDARKQDFGSTLVLILGTPAVAAVVKAIGDWLKLRTSATLTIETPEKHLIVRNITSKDAAQLAERFLSQM